jgi:hypothetical protein
MSKVLVSSVSFSMLGVKREGERYDEVLKKRVVFI